jgi:hypothetical protein
LPFSIDTQVSQAVSTFGRNHFLVNYNMLTNPFAHILLSRSFQSSIGSRSRFVPSFYYRYPTTLYAHVLHKSVPQYDALVREPVTTSPIVYLAPIARAQESDWHLLEAKTNTIRTYRAPPPTWFWQSNNVAKDAYNGAIFSPVSLRVFFMPWGQTAQSNDWHYVNTLTGEVVAYQHKLSASRIASIFAYSGGVYSPSNDR